MSVKNLDAFKQRINTLAVKIEKNTDKIIRTASLSAHGSVVLATPVDTGRARANWIVTRNRPASGTREPASGKDSTPPGGGPSAQKAIDQGQRVIGQRKVGDSIHITNNLPYTSILNTGTSAQAPEMFVEKAVQKAIQGIKGAKLLE